MDLSAIIDEFNRRKAQAGQRITDMFTPPKKPANWFEQMQQGQNAVITPEQRSNVHKELADIAERMAQGMVPPMIRERAQAMKTDPSAAAKPFTSEEIKQATPFVTGAAPIAYHGTPHQFDKFDASKIGTGEGAQSYGHGLYFAENPEVANQYHQQLSLTKKVVGGQTYDSDNPQHLAASLLNTFRNKPDPTKTVIDELTHDINLGTLTDAKVKNYQEVIDMLKGGKPLPKVDYTRSGGIYQVNIPDQHAAKMLDWDKPLSEQPEVLNKLAKLGVYKEDFRTMGLSQDPTGGDIYQMLFNDRNSRFFGSQAQVSKELQDLGIPGIKYLDQGSRIAGQGTRNFVVFDPAILEDVTRK